MNNRKQIESYYSYECEMQNGEFCREKPVRQLEQDYTKLLLLGKDMIEELKLSNDQNLLEIDGDHMNIFMAWLELEKFINKKAMVVTDDKSNFNE